MREIEYQAWDKREHKMIADSDIAETIYNRCIWCEKTKGATCKNKEFGFVMIPPDCDQFELRQYIGRNGEGGKKIYEGDICSAWDSFIEWVGVIVWADLHAGFYLEENQDSAVPVSSLTRYRRLGNIYENPELLEARE